jgi:hypothetical protein
MLLSKIVNKGEWKWDSYSFLFQIHAEIEGVNIYKDREKDFWAWKCTRDGSYQFKNIWNTTRTSFEIKFWSCLVWNKIHVPKMAVCLFKAVNDFLLTKERLMQKLITVDPLCVFCNKHIETIVHLFFQCDYTGKIWLWSCKKFFKAPKSLFSFSLKEDLNKIVSFSRTKSLKSDLFQLSLSMCVWHIWRERNERIFQNRFSTSSQICHNIYQTMFIRMTKSKHFKNISGTDEILAMKWGYTSQR